MKTKPIALVRIQGAVSQGAVIAAEELAHHMSTSNVLLQAKREAEALRLQAKNTLAEAKKQSAHIRQQARLQGQQEAEEFVEEARTKAVSDTIRWLVAEDDMEQVIANRLEKRIRSIAVQALLEFARKQEPVELLVQRLTHKIPEILQAEQKLQLRVHPWNLSIVQGAFYDELQVRISTDDTLSSGQAVLENDLMMIMIDLDAHLNVLVERLLNTSQTARGEQPQDPSVSTVNTAQRYQSTIQAVNRANTHHSSHPKKDGTHG